MAGALGCFWCLGAYVTEGRTWLDRTLALDGAPAPAVRAKALRWAGALAAPQGHAEQAIRFAQAALDICRSLDDKRGAVDALLTLGAVADWQGDLAQAIVVTEEALVLVRDLGDDRMTCLVLNNLGYAAYLHGDLARARPIMEEALLLTRNLGGQADPATVFHSVGEVRRAGGDFEGAEAAYREGLALAWDGGVRIGVVDCVEGLGILALVSGKLERAAHLLGAAETQRCETNLPIDPHLHAEHSQTVFALRKALGEAAFTAAWDAGRALSLEEAVTEALALADAITGEAVG